jgi:hypothetical protein
MARALVKIAFGGIAISVVCLASAVVLVTSAIADTLPFGRLLSWDSERPNCPAVDSDFSAVSREMEWDNGTGIGLAIPGTLHYRPGARRQIILRGPSEIIGQIELSDDKLRLRCNPWMGMPQIEIDMAGDALSRFSVFGSGDMVLEGLAGDEISLSIAGSGSITASGTADELEISIAGSGDADSGGLDVRRAQVSIAGSGNATVFPRERLEASLVGSGDVRVLTNPDDIESTIIGSGRVETIRTN